MATTMRGLLKGLRYISQIFDEDKEPEMQIGVPTDVKHVAHIGCDGSSNTMPSWMRDFNAAELDSSHAAANDEGLQELLPPTQNHKSKQKAQRKSTATTSPTNKTNSGAPKSSRRQQSSHKSVDLPERDSSRGKKHRQRHSTSGFDDATGSYSDKHSRHRKSKSRCEDSGSAHSKSQDESSLIMGTRPIKELTTTVGSLKKAE